MIELEKIEGLVKILEASSLTEMTVRDGEFKITMSKLDNPPVVAAGAAVAPAPAAVSVSAEVKEEKSTEDSGNILFRSGSRCRALRKDRGPCEERTDRMHTGSHEAHERDTDRV